jgi:hypothetical protein
MYEIEQLQRTGSAIVGYRLICGRSKNDPTLDIFKEFEKEVEKLRKSGIVIAKIARKVDNVWVTLNGGWWHEFEFRIIPAEYITPNVNLIIKEKYRIITKIPATVRKELNNAVKNGILIHFKKDGIIPECYCFIGYEREAKNKLTSNGISDYENLKKVLI